MREAKPFRFAKAKHEILFTDVGAGCSTSMSSRISFAPLTEGPYLEAFEDWVPCFDQHQEYQDLFEMLRSEPNLSPNHVECG